MDLSEISRDFFENPWNNPGILNSKIIHGFEQILELYKDARNILGISYNSLTNGLVAL
jgi:hypothetical protein